MINWMKLSPQATNDSIPLCFNEDDSRPAKEQFPNWNKIGGLMLARNLVLQYYHERGYTDDPPVKPLWMGWFRDEQIIVYENFILIRQKDDGSWEISRNDTTPKP